VTSVEDHTLPGAMAATVTQAGGLVYSGTLGVVELSVEDLLHSDAVVRNRFRLPERQHSVHSAQDPDAPAVVIDYPLVDRLLAFGPEEDHLLGYGGIQGAAAWVADLSPGR